jgi:3-oxoacyl-[acyl-carrier-protein] synthase-1
LTTVHVIDVAARTPVGLNAAASTAAVRAGISQVRQHPFMVDRIGNPLVAAFDARLPLESFGDDRVEALWKSVSSQLAHLHSLARRYRVGTSIGLPALRPGCPPTPTWTAGNAVGRGHAGFATLLRDALRQVREGQVDIAVVGAADSYLHADTLDWLEDHQYLARSGVRGGFPPGEGAAAIAIADERTRASLGLASLAEIDAVVTHVETMDAAADEGLQGVALSQVYRDLGGRLRDGGQFDHVYIDLNGERARSTDYAFALLREGHRFRDGARYNSPVSQTGELGAALGAFNCVRAAISLARGLDRGEHTLISSSSWGGQRGGILLRRSRR